jgi:hypothetical protein
MISFNALLQCENVDSHGVKLVRHRDTRFSVTPYQLWMGRRRDFDIYQQIQTRPVFAGAKSIASFVVTPFDETLFVGLYSVNGVGETPNGLIDPLTGKSVDKMNFYKLEPMLNLSDYEGRLVVDWGSGYRSWVQWARKQDKPVREIRRAVSEPPFPGYLRFRTRLSELASVPASWRIALSAVSGTYLLVHPESVKPYVGKAFGIGGFWARWEQYVASGHGGNRRMMEVPAADYHVTILEVASMPATEDALDEMEGRWKLKLLSRKFGLNAN